MAQAEFLTIPEVAALLRIGERTTYDLARKGELVGAVKVGNQWRVDRRVLRQWAEAQGRSATKGTSIATRHRKQA